MKKQTVTANGTHWVRTVFLLVLPFFLSPSMHQTLGQGNTDKRSLAANLSQVAPPSTGAITWALAAPVNRAPNIPASGQSYLPTVSSGAAAAKPAGVLPMPIMIVVSEVTPDAGWAGYTVTASGICDGGVTVGNLVDAPGPWTTGNPYPTTIMHYGFAQTSTHFYVFGGVSNGTRVSDVNRMDIAIGVWESRAPMPFASAAPTCALMASTGIVYCTEGDTGSGFASYNIATDTWTSLASIPGGNHYGSASGAFNGRVFVAGGTAATTNAVQVYNVASNTWSAETVAPNAFLLAGYQQVGQFLYVVGGFDATLANNSTTLRLDMSSAP